MSANDSTTLDTLKANGRETRANLHGAIDRAADLAQPTADRLASKAHAGVDRVGDKLESASDTLSDRRKQVNEAYRHFTESSRVQVRSNPITAVLVAAAAGYAFSKLFGSRK